MFLEGVSGLVLVVVVLPVCRMLEPTPVAATMLNLVLVSP